MRAAAFLAFALTCSAADSEVRKPWQNTRLVGSPEKAPQMVAVPAYPKLPVKRPVVIEWEPGTDRLLVLENLAWDTYKTTLNRGASRKQIPISHLPYDVQIPYCLQLSGGLT